MSKPFVLRSILAILCGLILASFLAACGGGGDDGEPVNLADAKCELKDYEWSRPGRPSPNARFDSDYIPVFIDYADSGRQFALVHLTAGYYYASVISNSWVILHGTVNDALHFPVDRATQVQLSYLLGTLEGHPVRGEGYQNIFLGSGYDYIMRDEVMGITPAGELPLVLSAPLVAELEHRRFQLSGLEYQLNDWARLGATIDVSVTTIVFGAENTTYRLQRCELKGLAAGETVAVIGGLDGDTYILEARSHASLDNNIQAYSKPVYQRLVY